MDFNIAENDARQNCCPRIYHHGLADGHYGLGKKIIALSLAKRLINLFQMNKNTWVPPTSDPNGQVIKLTQLYILRLLGVSTFRSMTHRSFSC